MIMRTVAEKKPAWKASYQFQWNVKETTKVLTSNVPRRTREKTRKPHLVTNPIVSGTIPQETTINASQFLAPK